MKVLTSRVVAYAIMSVLVSGASMVAYADPVPVDYKVVTSKAYVDNELALKQNVLPAKDTATTQEDAGPDFWYAPIGGQTIALGLVGVPEKRYITKGLNNTLTDTPAADPWTVLDFFDSTANSNTAARQMASNNFGTGQQSDRVLDAIVSLELLRDVYKKLDNEIQNAIPTGPGGNVAMYDPNGDLGDGVATYSGATTQNPYNAGTDANKIATAAAVETKQDKITATSDGTNSTPNYVYNATTNPTADGSVITTTTTAGTTSQRGIATAATRDGSGNLTNGNWLPTISAVESMVSDSDISSHKVNGAPLSNTASYFYGEGVGAADTATKTVSIPSITGTPAVGQVIVVKPATTNTSSTININLNNTAAYSVLYRGSSSNIPKDVWTAYVPSIFVLDETSGGTKYWRYVGTSPVAMTWFATETTASNAYSTTFDGTTNNWPVADENKYVKGDSFAQGLALKQNKIPAGTTPNNTNGSLLTYTNSAGTVGEKYIIGSHMFSDLVDGIENWTNDYRNMLVNAGDIGPMLQRLGWSSIQSAAINAYNTTFGTGTNNWMGYDGNLITGQFLANSLALKQNKIPAGTAGEILTYSGTAGQLGTPWVVLSNLFGEDEDAIENYSITFNGTDGNWTTGSAGKLITTNILAKGLALKQAILQPKNTGDFAPSGNQAVTRGGTLGSTLSAYITAGGSVGLTTRSGAPAVINYVNGTTTDLATFTSGTFGTNSTAIQNYIKGALVSLELLKDVYAELNSKITNNALPTGTTGTVVTYNGTNPQTGVQQFTETAIVDAPVYTNGNLTNGDSVPSVEYVENALDTKQPIIQPSTVSGKTQIVVKPAYGGTAGEVGYLTLDTSSLTVSSDSTVPSSKLLSTQLSAKYDLGLILDTDETDIYAGGFSGAPSWAATSGTENLYRIPGEVSGDNWAAKIMDKWATHPNVPTMDTLANSLAGLYEAVGGSIDDRIIDYRETSSDILDSAIIIPDQISYTGDRYLDDGTQLFWLPSLALAGNTAAGSFLNRHTDVAPSMDELAYALDGVLQTHETTMEWHTVAGYYGVNAVVNLYEIADKIRIGDTKAMNLYRSGYLQTFAPTLEALMDESYSLYKLIEQKQTKLSGPNGNLVTYGANAGATGAKAIATTITNDANTVPNTEAVYKAVNERQNRIPVAGKYRSSNTATADTTISDWTATDVKGTALVTKTSSNGVVGERRIFEAGATYTNDAATNIQIATIGAVMENTFTKTCVEYRPGTTGETATNCWLWQITSNANSSGLVNVCSNPRSCSLDTDCCAGYSCGRSGTCEAEAQSGRS